MSDLLNDPSRPACGCDHCTKYPSAWADGSILARIRSAMRARWHHRGGGRVMDFPTAEFTPEIW